MKRSQLVSLIAIFTALNVVCDSISGISLFEYGVWWSWIFLIVPITGFILGPYAGFMSTFFGVIIGHFIYFRGAPEFLFAMGAPIGAMISGLLFRGKWKTAFLYYTVLFITYFATPIAWKLPVWGMWDTYLAYAGLFTVAVILSKRKSENSDKKESPYSLALYAFIGLEADILFRIFLLIPCQTYRLIYGWPVEVLQGAWALAATVTPIQVALSVLVTSTIGIPLIRILLKTGYFQ